MIRYICNRCRKEIERKKDVILIQTKRGDETSVAHLCPTCHKRIKELCATYLKEEHQKNTDTTGVKPSVDMTKGDDFLTEEGLLATRNFDVDVASFNKEMEKVPRGSTIPGFQRVLLALYKGMSCSKVADLVGKSYQEIYRVRSRYGCQRIAEKHLAAERLNADVIRIIDTFITCGDFDEVVIRTKFDKVYVSSVLSEYSGLVYSYTEPKEDNTVERNFPINVEGFPDAILKQPRATSLLTVMRIVLCAYKGMGPTEISNIVRKTAQETYRFKACYTCKEIAERHLQKDRMDYDVVSIIDTFIQCGDIHRTCTELGIDEDKVRGVLAYYTGLLKEE